MYHQTGLGDAVPGMARVNGFESHSGGQSLQVLGLTEEPVTGRGGIPARYKHSAGNLQS